MLTRRGLASAASVLILCLCLSLGACGTIANTAEGPQLYGGVRHNLAKRDRGIAESHDITFCLVADTVLLPVTALCEVIRAATGWPPSPDPPARPSDPGPPVWTILVDQFVVPYEWLLVGRDPSDHLVARLQSDDWYVTVLNGARSIRVYVGWYRSLDRAERALAHIRRLRYANGRIVAPNAVLERL